MREDKRREMHRDAEREPRNKRGEFEDKGYSKMMRSPEHSMKEHHMGHKFVVHHDNDLHRDYVPYEGAHGGAEGSRPMGKEYKEGMNHDGMSIREAEDELKTHSGGRMARQARQRRAEGMVDDTVYPNYPPRSEYYS